MRGEGVEAQWGFAVGSAGLILLIFIFIFIPSPHLSLL